MNSEFIKKARARMGMTQKALATALRLSPKAIQSYEQGWRAVPEPIAAHLLTLLAVCGGGGRPEIPCWVVTRCPPERRRGCPARATTRGAFCWMVSGTACRRGGVDGCLSCRVVRRLTT